MPDEHPTPEHIHTALVACLPAIGSIHDGVIVTAWACSPARYRDPDTGREGQAYRVQVGVLAPPSDEGMLLSVFSQEFLAEHPDGIDIFQEPDMAQALRELRLHAHGIQLPH